MSIGDFVLVGIILMCLWWARYIVLGLVMLVLAGVIAAVTSVIAIIAVVFRK